MRVSQNTKAIMYMLFSTLSLAVTGLVTQYLATQFAAVEITLLRFWMPAIVLFAFLTVRGLRIPPTSMHRVLMIRSLCIAACQFCFIYALGKLSLLESVVLFGTGPLFIALFEKFLFRIPLSIQTIAALIITFLGVIFLAGDTEGFTLKTELIIGLMAGVFNAGSQLSLHRASKGELSGVENNAWTFLLAGMLLTPVGIFYYSSLGMSAELVTVAFKWLGVETMMVILLLTVMIINTQVCRYQAYKSAETNTQVAPLIYTNLIFTAIFQFALFDTSFSTMQMFGIGMIVFGGLVPVLKSAFRWINHTMKVPHSSSSSSN
ncbi:DMT family transporter [Vibrio wakamikoensis]